MLAELRQKAQVTIPREIIVKLGLSEGDKLDIFEKSGGLQGTIKERQQKAVRRHSVPPRCLKLP